MFTGYEKGMVINMNSSRIHNEHTSKEVIVLSNSVYHSYRGEYFLGQTDLIKFGGLYYAWGGLVNPRGSNVDMFLNAYTISNYSIVPITAQGWLSSRLVGTPRVSHHYAAGNQAMEPPCRPKVSIQSSSYVIETPIGGTYTFVRRVEPNLTLTKHDFQGMYIVPPGSSFLLFFLPPSSVKMASSGNEFPPSNEIPTQEVNVKIAFGWWEETR
jgi:hypothetical protein